MLSVTGKNSVGFTQSAKGTSTFYAENPVTQTFFETPFFTATDDEVDRAATLANDAFRFFRNVDSTIRRDFLYAIAKEMRLQSEALIHWFCAETALPKDRAIAELNRACFQFESYADSLLSGEALQVKIDTDQKNIRKMNVPVGPVVVFGASNFPFAYGTLGGDTASALAAGCPVIVKAHPMHPHTSELSAHILLGVAKHFQLPDGIFSHLFAGDYQLGSVLVQHPLVKAVGFTGSIRGGLALVKLAQERPIPIPVYAEMGSSNPMVFSQNALKERSKTIAAQVAQAIGNNSGQFCTSPGLLFVIESDESQLFESELIERLSSFAPQVMLHSGIFKNYVSQAERQITGAAVLLDGLRERNLIEPTLVAVSGLQFLADSFRQEEVFGSFATLIRCVSEDELISCLESLHGQLTASIFHEESDDITNLIAILMERSGRIIFNGVPTGVAVSAAMQHGGPFPSSSDPRTTSVGSDAVLRFMRSITLQNVSDEIAPKPLKNDNSTGILRFVNGKHEK